MKNLRLTIITLFFFGAFSSLEAQKIKFEESLLVLANSLNQSEDYNLVAYDV